jgi:predicted nucleotidyltransferase
MKVYIFGKKGLEENIPDLLQLLSELLGLGVDLILNKELEPQITDRQRFFFLII